MRTNEGDHGNYCPQAISEVPIDLAFAVISQGSILYERDIQTKIDCEARIMGLYFDYLPFLKLARQDIIKGDDDHADRVRRYRTALGRTQKTLGQVGADQGKKPVDSHDAIIRMGE